MKKLLIEFVKMGEFRLRNKMGSDWAHQFYGGRWTSGKVRQPVHWDYAPETPPGQGSDTLMLIAYDGR